MLVHNMYDTTENNKECIYPKLYSYIIIRMHKIIFIYTIITVQVLTAEETQ
jgi:hypothetical protein